MLDIREILDMLYTVKSPSGYEKEMAALISKTAEDGGLTCEVDALGNLIVHREGVGKRCIIDAHMDTTGLMATYIEKDGFIRFDTIGSLIPSDINGASVEFLNGVKGKVSYDGKCEISKLKTTSMFIDIGAKDEESARKCVLPGDAAVFAGKVNSLYSSRISAPYLDNRLGCAILLYTLLNLKECEYDVYGVFSAQEEVGFRGARTAAYDLEADFAIVIDITESFDTPSCEGSGETKLSGGVAVKVMDSSYVAHPAICSAFIETAEKRKISVCREVITTGGTNGAGIQTVRGGVPTGGISVPVRYIHTPCEVADMNDVKMAAELLIATLENHSVIL